MKDDKGLYYLPFPANKRVRMYVKPVGDDVCFRLWNADDPRMWDEHGWLPWTMLREAVGLYEKKQKGFDPKQAYDIGVARALLKEGS